MDTLSFKIHSQKFLYLPIVQKVRLNLKLSFWSYQDIKGKNFWKRDVFVKIKATKSKIAFFSMKVMVMVKVIDLGIFEKISLAEYE